MKNKSHHILKRPFSSSTLELNIKNKAKNLKINSSKNNLRILSACLSTNNLIPNNLNYGLKSAKNKYNYTTNFSSSKFKSKYKTRPQTTTCSSNLFSRTNDEDLDYLNLIVNSNPNQFNKNMIKKKKKQINSLYIIGSDENMKRPKFSYKTEETFYNYNLLYGNKSHNLIKTYSPKMHPSSSGVKIFLKKFNKTLKENIPIFTEEEILLFCNSKCKDIGTPFKENIFYKFKEFCNLRCKNRIADLSDGFFGIYSIKFLIDILKNEDRITRLNLSKNNIGDQGVELLCTSLKNSKSLISLDLSSNSISHIGGNIIFKTFINQQSIINLDLSSHEGVNRNRLTSKGLNNIFEFLKKNLFVEKLNLSGNSLKNVGCNLIFKGLNNNITLKELSIGNNDITEKGLKQGLKYINNSKLIALNLSGNSIKNEGIILFVNNLRHFHELRSLNISNCNIEYKGFKELLKVLQNVRRIESLDISNNKLNSEKFEELKTYFTSFGLKYLNLSRCHLGDESSFYLGECLLVNETIKKLNISNNKITDNGFKSFVKLLSNNNIIEHLDLSCNLISDETAIEFIKNAEFNISLKYLNLYDNQIKNDIGGVIMNILNKNKTLNKINLLFNRVQLKTIEEINEKLKMNNIIERKKIIPEIERSIQSLEFNPKEFEIITKKIITKKEKEKLIMRKIKEEQKYYDKLKKKENKLVKKKEEELKNVEEKLKIINKKIFNCNNNMSLVEQNFVTDENEIKKQIKITNHEKSEIENEHIKAKADYDITKKEMEEIINKTRLKYIESQDKIIYAQIALSKINSTYKKLDKLYENLNNSHNLSPIKKKELKRTSTTRVKSLSIKKLNELDTNKININTNKNNQKEKNILTSSTSPTINDINKKQIDKNNSNK